MLSRHRTTASSFFSLDGLPWGEAAATLLGYSGNPVERATQWGTRAYLQYKWATEAQFSGLVFGSSCKWTLHPHLNLHMTVAMADILISNHIRDSEPELPSYLLPIS
jgi:hypothetical protein